MTEIINLITKRITYINATSIFTYIDLAFALALVFAFLWYIRRLPIFRVFLGTLLLILCALLFLFIGFIFTAIVFGFAGILIVMGLPVIFGQEIRHYLEKLGRLSFIKIPTFTDTQKTRRFIREFCDAVEGLAHQSIGATIVFQRKTRLAQTIETGVMLNAEFSGKLLLALFEKTSPLHDGAIVMQTNKIIAAACLLPISGDIILDKKYGTRHRSGFAITADTDALVVIISEQRGEITFARNSEFHSPLTKIELAEQLTKYLIPRSFKKADSTVLPLESRF